MFTISRHNISRNILGVSFFLMSIFLTGCPSTTTNVQNQNKNNNLDKVIAKIYQRSRKIKTLEGSAKLRLYQSSRKRRTLRVFFQIQRPNRLHLQIVIAAGQTGVIIKSDGKIFTVYDLFNKNFTTGPASELPSLLGAYVPIPLPTAQLISVLLGEIPILKAPKQTVSKENNGKVLRLYRKGPNHEQTVDMDSQHARFLSTSLQRKGKSPVKLTYSGYRGTSILAKRLKFSISKQKIKSIRWIYTSVVKNPNIKASSFQQKVPKNVRVIRIKP